MRFVAGIAEVCNWPVISTKKCKRRRGSKQATMLERTRNVQLMRVVYGKLITQDASRLLSKVPTVLLLHAYKVITVTISVYYFTRLHNYVRHDILKHFSILFLIYNQVRSAFEVDWWKFFGIPNTDTRVSTLLINQNIAGQLQTLLSAHTKKQLRSYHITLLATFYEF